MPDARPRVFRGPAGVLAMHGLDVLAAAAHSTDDGRALAEFKVADRFRAEPPWPKVLADLDLALDGRLAVDARVADRARRYGRRAAVPVAPPSVHVDVDASPAATVIDVHAPDGVGVLHRITKALAELDLDIRSAKVETMGEQVVDAFYVRDRQGRKVTDPHHLTEIEKAILHALA
jgi:[protein-PII] uridylyltransferase